MLDALPDYVSTGLAYLGAVVVGLAALAPLTPTKWDDKVLAVLQKVLAAVKLLKAPK